MSKSLRPYQEAAIRAAFKHQSEQLKIDQDKRKGAMIVLPTGCGKTFTALSLIDRFLRRAEVKGHKPRVTWLAHRHELIVQPVRDLMQLFPRFRSYTGIVNASNRQWRAQIRFASIDTLKVKNNLTNFVAAGRNDLLIVDECHHAPAPGWSEVIWGPSGLCPSMLVGLTATPLRQDGLDVWERWDPVSALTIEEAIRDGYLTPYVMREQLVDLDLAEVPTRGDGDYNEEKLGEILLKSGVVNTTALAVKNHAPPPGGAPGIVFCATVEQAELTATALRGAGYRAASLDGTHGAKEREGIVEDLRRGRLQVVTNCSVLTEGFDCPAIAWVVFARPFKSLSLYFQAAGRALRPHSSKPKGEPAVLINLTPHAPRSLSLPAELLRALSALLPPPPPSAPSAPSAAPLEAPAEPLAPASSAAGLSGLLAAPNGRPELAPAPLAPLLSARARALLLEGCPPEVAAAAQLAAAGPGVALLAPLPAPPTPAPPEASGAALPPLAALPEAAHEPTASLWVGWWWAPSPGGLPDAVPAPVARSPLPYASLVALLQGLADHADASLSAARRRGGQPPRELTPPDVAEAAAEWLSSGLWTVLV